jgi:hypothetical protein
MTELEIVQLLLEINALHNVDIQSLESEMKYGNDGFSYQLVHNNMNCKLELFKRENVQVSRITVDSFQSEYLEGTEIFRLINEFSIGM